MNGRELIIHILLNDLENIDIFSEEFFKALLPSIENVAVQFNVGVATVNTWLDNGYLEGVEFNGVTYIFPNSLEKFAEKKANLEVSNV